ncbi:MAG: hypothetical protein MJH09_11480 [Cetobacterium sp.]|nr:hypothetical protein [Cetobacterium sp.]
MKDRKDIIKDFQNFQLVKLSKGYRVEDFNCGLEEYNNFLKQEALNIQEKNISKVHLLINKKNGDIVAYFTLSSCAINLSSDEKISHGVDDIIFNSFPCVKIGKLASDLKYSAKYSNIINFLIQIIIGIVNDSINLGVASRFLIVDADIENNPNINEIYEKNGFKYNETLRKGKNKKVSTISMRLDMFT